MVGPKFYDHTSNAINVGFVHGAYHFARPASSSGSVQADFFLANGGAWIADGMTLPGMLDLEDNPSGSQCYGLSRLDMIDWIIDFVDTYSGITGRFPMMYTTTGGLLVLGVTAGSPATAPWYSLDMHNCQAESREGGPRILSGRIRIDIHTVVIRIYSTEMRQTCSHLPLDKEFITIARDRVDIYPRNVDACFC